MWAWVSTTAETKLLLSLEQSGVDEHASPGRRDEEARSGDRTGCT
jgi:hypothetical protein